MFNNNRQSRRRFGLGNLARLVQSHQSVSRQPQQPLPSPPETLQEILLKSPPKSPSFQPQQQSPSSQPQPQSPSFTPSPSTLPPSFSKSDENRQSSPHIPLEQNSSPRSPAFMSQPLQPQSSIIIPISYQFSPMIPSPSTLPRSFSEAGENCQSPQLVQPGPKSSPQSPTSQPKQPQQLLQSPHQLQPQLIQPQQPPSSSLKSGEYQTPPLTSVLSPPLTPKAKTPPSSPSTQNATLDHQFQPLPLFPLSKSVDETLSPSNSIEEPKSTQPLSESSQNYKSQTHSSPPQPPLSPKASKNLQSQPPIQSLPKPQSPTTLTIPPQPQTSIETTRKVNKNKGSAIWSEKQRPKPMRMIVNSNVQGFNTSLSLRSSSINHDPGVHLTID